MNITDTNQIKAKSLNQATVLPGREVLITHYNKIREFTEELCESHKIEDFVFQYKGNFIETLSFHPAPFQSKDGLNQMCGDVWEWTRSSYSPYPGCKPLSGALGEYNGKFMSNQMVLRGESCATSKNHIRNTYRNFFPPHSRWQFMGIRLAKETEK